MCFLHPPPTHTHKHTSVCVPLSVCLCLSLSWSQVENLRSTPSSSSASGSIVIGSVGSQSSLWAYRISVQTQTVMSLPVYLSAAPGTTTATLVHDGRWEQGHWEPEGIRRGLWVIRPFTFHHRPLTSEFTSQLGNSDDSSCVQHFITLWFGGLPKDTLLHKIAESGIKPLTFGSLPYEHTLRLCLLPRTWRSTLQWSTLTSVVHSVAD